jgi:hypothetical protein
MGDLLGMLGVGETGDTWGRTWGRSGSWGSRVGSRTHFSVGHLGESGSLKWQVLEILVCLSLGNLTTLGVLIGKWKSDFIRGLGMEGLGLWIEGWVFGFEHLIWGLGARSGEKKLEIFDLRKGFRKRMVGTKLKGRRL